MRKPFLLFILQVWVLLPVSAETGAQIMQRVMDNQNPASSAMDMEMTLIDSRGDTGTRRIQTLILNDGGLTKTVTVFLEPASVRNTRFLSVENPDRGDDQWIYLPALQKVRRIASGEKEGSFMGSDFSYEDMSTREIDESTHTRLRPETLNGRACQVVESVPLPGTESAYGKMISWVDDQTSLTLRVEFYGKDGTGPVKILTREGFRQVGSRWTAERTVMETVATGHRTVMDLKQVKFDIPISAAYFSTGFLQTGRP